MNRRYFSEWENWHKTFISSRILFAGYISSRTRSSADADNALDANEAVPNKWRADGTHNTYQSY